MKLHYILFTSIVLVFALEDNMMAQWTTESGSTIYACQFVSMLDTGNGWGLGYSSFYPFDTTVVYRRLPPWGWDVWGGDLPLHTVFTAFLGVDINTGFAGSEYGKVYKTTNGGYYWMQILDAGQETFVGSIKFSKLQRNTGYIICSRPFGSSQFVIYKTTNYGNTWQTQIHNFGDYYGSFESCITDSAHVWYGLYSKSSPHTVRIVFTTNGGNDWNITDREQGRVGCDVVCFKNDNQYGLSISHLNFTDPILSRSTDGGFTWSIIDTLGYNNAVITNLITIPESSVWYLGVDGNDSALVKKSTDDGLTWFNTHFEQDPGLILDMDAIRYNDKIYVYATTAFWGIMRLIDTPVVFGIRNINDIAAEHFSLSQNYPNPFNPVTKIKFSIPLDSRLRGNDNVTLMIYDVLGREAATLVNEKLNPGTYEVTWDASSYPSGVYFYKLTASDYSETKKMVLIK